MNVQSTTVQEGTVNYSQEADAHLPHHADALCDEGGEQIGVSLAYSTDINLQSRIELLLLLQMLLAGCKGRCHVALMAS